VIAKLIRRDATLHLAALRLLMAGDDVETTRTLQRYVLGLALTALTHSPSGYLRQGCNLVLSPEQPREFKLVHNDGRREDCTLSHEDSLAFATLASAAFGVGPSRDVDFDNDRAKADTSDAGEKKPKTAKGKKA
jgi:CRISPR-associated protein Csb1